MRARFLLVASSLVISVSIASACGGGDEFSGGAPSAAGASGTPGAGGSGANAGGNNSNAGTSTNGGTAGTSSAGGTAAGHAGSTSTGGHAGKTGNAGKGGMSAGGTPGVGGATTQGTGGHGGDVGPAGNGGDTNAGGQGGTGVQPAGAGGTEPEGGGGTGVQAGAGGSEPEGTGGTSVQPAGAGGTSVTTGGPGGAGGNPDPEGTGGAGGTGVSPAGGGGFGVGGITGSGGSSTTICPFPEQCETTNSAPASADCNPCVAAVATTFPGCADEWDLDCAVAAHQTPACNCAPFDCGSWSAGSDNSSCDTLSGCNVVAQKVADCGDITSQCELNTDGQLLGQCFAIGTVKSCHACEPTTNQGCARGLSCVSGVCLRTCCSDGACDSGDTCDTNLLGSTVGICVTK